ncbi:hypothetical protein HY441_00555 [Candidatus Microgenomates bacterium]|nr:hypothetical protein [Candidatus Microgenomates bacterium]
MASERYVDVCPSDYLLEEADQIVQDYQVFVRDHDEAAAFFHEQTNPESQRILDLLKVYRQTTKAQYERELTEIYQIREFKASGMAWAKVEGRLRVAFGRGGEPVLHNELVKVQQVKLVDRLLRRGDDPRNLAFTTASGEKLEAFAADLKLTELDTA